MFTPLSFLLGWLIGPLSIAALGFSVYYLWEWGHRVQDGSYHPFLGPESIGMPPFGVAPEMALALAAASSLWVLWSLFGRYVVLAFYRKGDDEPRSVRRQSAQLTTRNGVRIHVEIEGPEGAPVLVMTHGWGLDSTAWYYVRKHLALRFRLVMWDLPGLGRSSRPKRNDFSVDELVEYQRAVIESIAGPVILLGHSIGGMMTLTLCRRFPELMQGKVAGAILMNTTYTQPLRTMWMGEVLRVIDRPILRPLLYLTIVLAPLVWLWSWMSYLNGNSHLFTRFTSFSRGVTRGQLDFGAWFTPKQNPAVLARGLLALLRWDESTALPAIGIPIRLIAAADDRVTLPGASHDMVALLPAARLAHVSPAGHAGLLEQGRTYSDAVAQWVDGFAATSGNWEGLPAEVSVAVAPSPAPRPY